jgi:hypothetical protein
MLLKPSQRLFAIAVGGALGLEAGASAAKLSAAEKKG